MNPLPSHQSGRAEVSRQPVSGSMQRLLEPLMRGTAIPSRIVFANGAEYRHGEAPPRFTIRFRTHRGERRLLRYGHVGILEAYFDGDVDFEGDIALAFRVALDMGFTRTHESAGVDSQSLARVQVLQPLDTRKPRPMRAPITASARRSTRRGSTGSA